MAFRKYFIKLTISVFVILQLSASVFGSAASPASALSSPCSVFLSPCSVLPPPSSGRKSRKPVPVRDSLAWSVNYVKELMNGSGEWFLTRDYFRKPIKGVIDYAENDPIDTVVVHMNQFLQSDTIPIIFNRKVENIPNKRRIPGYVVAEDVDKQADLRRTAVADSVQKTFIVVPDDYLNEGLSKVRLLPPSDPRQSLSDMERNLPPAFRHRFSKSLGNLKIPANASAAEIDTLKSKLFVWTRQLYNDSILFFHRDSLMRSYREGFIAQLSADAAVKKKNCLIARNREILTHFNEGEVARVNDSIRMALNYLTDRAMYDSTLVTVTNLTGLQAKAWTANRPMTPMRIFLKNEQNDSINVILFSNGKGGLRMVINDGVKFLRMTESQKKEITFAQKKLDSKLLKVNIRQIDPLPWKFLGTGTVGFTQTALSNWAKGGESSLSVLVIGRYTANYSKKSVKWENMAEFRLGFFSSKSRGVEKNDDKLEFQSRVGYSAFKNWYYSAESNFRTQIARGYKFPDKVNPISTFMAPAYLTFSIGMDYKPNKQFSLFLSPLTSKSTFVNDTALINPTHYGIDPGKKRLWEAGAIAKMNWHWPILDNITYDTRAEIFNNYLYPFRKFNVDWEQILVMQVNQHISTRVNTQVIYDYNVKFPVTDENGKVIDQQAKWQFRELFTIGFNYRF